MVSSSFGEKNRLNMEKIQNFKKNFQLFAGNLS
jgi:hypothetical protein